MELTRRYEPEHRLQISGKIARLRPLRHGAGEGIEPSYVAWEAAVLPLNYARGSLLCSAMPRILVAKEIFHIQGATLAFVQ